MSDGMDVRVEALRIGGARIGADRVGARVIEVRNPYTRALVGTVPKATVEEIRQAFAIAAAYKPVLTRFERANILRKAAAILDAKKQQVAELENCFVAEFANCNELVICQCKPCFCFLF